ncbi:hypothetical protein CEXT_267681 [Caerostris extrusa]|uniref:Uncharacterized protein n=1 Tax=Caerostris extrusa TaxID=172846 RepID=A0AAV4YDS1_CAEEX|nr:hypothetical protein CEXT_267681 [Caerostris extrusa]
MDIRNCEFCNAYVADFEVHTCRVFGNQHRQSSATLLRSCSDYIDGDIDLRTEQMPYEESIPSVNQTHSSWQHSILLNMRQKTDCEETPAAEMSSQYGAANQNLHNPKISNFLFPGTVHSEENETKSGYSLQPFEDNSVLINQTPQFCEAWNPNPDVNAPLPVAEPCFLPGFQQTFGQINERMNQISQNPNAYSEMGCSGHLTLMKSRPFCNPILKKATVH